MIEEAEDQNGKSSDPTTDTSSKPTKAASASPAPDDELAKLSNTTTAADVVEQYNARNQRILERMKIAVPSVAHSEAMAKVIKRINEQQSAINSMSAYTRAVSTANTPKLTLPNIPPNPIHATNRHLEQIGHRFEQMQAIATRSAEIATGLQAASAEFLVKFEAAANSNDRTAKRAIWLGAAAIVLAAIMPMTQIVYSHVTRENDRNNSAAEVVRLEAQLLELRNAHNEAIDRVTREIAQTGGETAKILEKIHSALTRDASGIDIAPTSAARHSPNSPQ